MGLYGKCYREDCTENLDGINSKECKLCGNRVCMKHLSYEQHHCPPTLFAKYIRRPDNILTHRGQNLTSGKYSVVCKTCGYISDYPKLIILAGTDLQKHIEENPPCMEAKRTFLEEYVPIEISERKVQSSIVRDTERKFWQCSLCLKKFFEHDEYLRHHFIHS